MLKKILYIIAVLLAAAAAVFLIVSGRIADPQDPSSGHVAESDHMRVVTTLFPLYDMARAIGGTEAEVSLLLPPGVSPHAFEPTPNDMKAIGESDLFVYTGDFLEPWADRVISGLGLDDARVLDASEGVRFLGMEEHGHEHESEGHEPHEGDAGLTHDGHAYEDDTDAHDDDHDTSGLDPHLWLDFENTVLMSTRIAEALSEADPEHAALYAERASEYAMRFIELDQRYRDGLMECRTRTIVYGGHYAFGYLAHRYDLAYEAAQGFSPDAEPSASELAALVGQVRSLGLSHIFSEALGSPKIAETIAMETGASVLELNPAGNLSRDAFESGVTFLEIMESNLEKLETGLGCHEVADPVSETDGEIGSRI